MVSCQPLWEQQGSGKGQYNLLYHLQARLWPSFRDKAGPAEPPWGSQGPKGFKGSIFGSSPQAAGSAPEAGGTLFYQPGSPSVGPCHPHSRTAQRDPGNDQLLPHWFQLPNISQLVPEPAHPQPCRGPDFPSSGSLGLAECGLLSLPSHDFHSPLGTQPPSAETLRPGDLPRSPEGSESPIDLQSSSATCSQGSHSLLASGPCAAT